jgi:hypothetical protein
MIRVRCGGDFEKDAAVLQVFQALLIGPGAFANVVGGGGGEADPERPGFVQGRPKVLEEASGRSKANVRSVSVTSRMRWTARFVRWRMLW